jgi:hypothetical protein
MKRFLCIFILLFLADAEGVKVRITPNKIKLEGQPGSIEQFTVIASNKEKKTCFLKAYIQDVVLGEEGDLEFLPKGSTTYSCATWVDISPENFSIPSESYQVISCKMLVPRNTVGSYIAAIICEILPYPEEVKGIGGSFIHMKIPILVNIDVGERIAERIEIGSISTGKDGFEVVVENKGEKNVTLKEGELLIKTTAGGLVSKGTLSASRYTLLRESSRIFRAKTEKLPDGNYLLEARVVYGKDEDKEVVAKTELSVKYGRFVFGKKENEKIGVKVEILPANLQFLLPQKRFMYEVVKVKNKEKEQVLVNVEKKGISLNEKGDFVYLSETDTTYSPFSLIEIFPESLKIPPLGVGILKYKVNIPPDGEGGRYGAFLFSLITDSGRKDEVYLPIDIAVQKKEKKGFEITELKIDTPRSGSLTASFKIKNCGNVKEDSEGEIAISDKDNKVVHKIPFHILLFPEGERRFLLSSSHKLNKGRFKADIFIDSKFLQTINFSVVK